MFLRKLFSFQNKFVWVLIDLVIVVVGVYCAFLIQNYADQQRNQKDQVRLLTALKYELEVFRFTMTGISQGMSSKRIELEEVRAQGRYGNFSNFRFIEPQYEYQTINYALGIQNDGIVDFQLYQALQFLYVEIKKIEHVERLLTETSGRYRSLPQNLGPKEEAYQLRWTDNYDNFGRFLIYIGDRGSISSQIALASEAALEIVDARLGPEKTRELEQEIISKNIRQVAETEEEAVAIGKTFFQHISSDEIRELFRSASEKSD